MTRYFRALIVVILISVLALTTLADGIVAPVLAQGSNVVIVNTSAVNIRSGPAPNTTSLGTVPGGTELAVTGRTADLTWWRVQSPFGVGWVSDIFVQFRGNIDSVPIVSEPSGTVELPVVIVDEYPATVYRNPNPDSFVVGIAPTGAILVVTGRSPDGNWWQVETVLGPGWVNVSEVALRGDVTIVPRVADPGPSFDGPTVRVNSARPVTTEPGGGEVIATLPAGATLPTGGRTADNTWWQVADVFGIGWIPVADVSLAGAAFNIRVTSSASSPTGPGYTGAAFATVTIEVERKVAYLEDSFGSAPMWDARLGEKLGVVGRSMDGLWLRVTGRGFIGWMNFSGITLNGSLAGVPIIDTSPVIVNIAIVDTHRLQIRTGPGVQYDDITSVPGGTTLVVTGRHPTLPWLRVEGGFGVGWVRIMYVIFRGYWDLVPLVTAPVGALDIPTAVIDLPILVYSQPSLDFPAGTVDGGIYPIVGWSPDLSWALLSTPSGEVWLPATHFALRGIADNAPKIE